LVDFFPNIFNPWLIESTDAASASMEGWLCNKTLVL
jgi:hypothetical protein